MTLRGISRRKPFSRVVSPCNLVSVPKTRTECVFVDRTLCFYEHLRTCERKDSVSKYCSMKERSITSTLIDLSVESTGSRIFSIKDHTVLNSHSLCLKLPCSEHRRAVYLLEYANRVARAKAAALIQDIYIYRDLESGPSVVHPSYRRKAQYGADMDDDHVPGNGRNVVANCFTTALMSYAMTSSLQTFHAILESITDSQTLAW